jgi:hypothetical protein
MSTQFFHSGAEIFPQVKTRALDIELARIKPAISRFADRHLPYWFAPLAAFGTVLRISRATTGEPSQGMFVRKRSVPALSSKASPDCVEAPR